MKELRACGSTCHCFLHHDIQDWWCALHGIISHLSISVFISIYPCCSPTVTLTTWSSRPFSVLSSPSLPYSELRIALTIHFPPLCLSTFTHPLRTKNEPLTGILQALDFKINHTLSCFSLKLFQVYVRLELSFVLKKLSTTFLSVECFFDKYSFRSQNWKK